MNQSELVKNVVRHPVHWFAFGFGSGLSPVAPGTFGTLMAVPFYYFLQDLSLLSYALFVLITAMLGIYFCGRSSQLLGVHDHGGIVWDEMVGYWLTMMFAPKGWQWMLAGFVLFRIFDIVKPWPISVADKRVHGGLGIMLDDILAAFLAMAFLGLGTYVFAV